jgi:beta-lactam-binding protein with PASTA domain
MARKKKQNISETVEKDSSPEENSLSRRNDESDEKSRAAEEEPSKPRKRRRRTSLSFLRFLVQLAVTTVLVFALLAAVSYFTLRHFIARQEVQVPNLVGLTLEEGLTRLKPLDLALILDKKEYSDIVSKGEILAQYPYAGTRTKIGNAVKVVVSEGTTLVEVPNVRGETFLRAGIRLRAADLQVGNVARAENTDVPNDAVIAQDPPPGSGVPRKYAVNLLVSEGSAPREFLMPNLAHATLKEAQAIITSLGLSVETVQEIDSAGVEKGTILAQQPPAGEIIRSDTKISLTVASGLDVLKKH